MSRAIDRMPCFSSRSLCLFYLAAKQKYPVRICAETCDFTGRGSPRVCLAKPSGGAKPCIDRVFLPHGPHSERSVSELLWWLFVARSSLARAMLHRARTYVWIITRACGEFAIIANVLSSLYGSPSVQQNASRRDATNLACDRASWIGRAMNLYPKTAPLFSSFMGLLIGEQITITDTYVLWESQDMMHNTWNIYMYIIKLPVSSKFILNGNGSNFKTGL